MMPKELFPILFLVLRITGHFHHNCSSMSYPLFSVINGFVLFLLIFIYWDIPVTNLTIVSFQTSD